MKANKPLTSLLGLNIILQLGFELCGGYPQYKDLDADSVILDGREGNGDVINNGVETLSELLHGVAQGSSPDSVSSRVIHQGSNAKQHAADIDQQFRQLHLYSMDSQDQNAGFDDDMEQLLRILLSQEQRKNDVMTSYFRQSPRMKRLGQIKVNKKHCWNVADVCCMWNICNKKRR